MSLSQNLNKKLVENYSKLVAELNKSVYPAIKNDKGNFEAPIISLGGGGGTIIENDETPIAAPALINVEFREVKPQSVVYRLAIPRNEAEIMDNKPEYFKYFFNKVLDKALANYKLTFGDPDTLRFGEAYVKLEIKDIKDGSDHLELSISGSWATENVV